MAKSKERMDAEKDHPMTSKEKLSNFWFYYRWWVMGGIFALVVGIIFIRDIGSNVKPDYTIGLLTQRTLPEATAAELEAAILPYIDDRNGDGQTVVYLSAYVVAVGDTQPADPMTHAANMTRLSGDIQMGESMLFITDELEAFQGTLELFCYNDGTDPPLEGEGDADYTRMGVPLTDCPALAAAGAGNGFVLVKRAIAPKQLERDDDLTAYYSDSMKLFDKMTQ